MSKKIKDEIIEISKNIDKRELEKFTNEIGCLIDKYSTTDLQGNYNRIYEDIERAIELSIENPEITNVLYFYYGNLLSDMRRIQQKTGQNSDVDTSYKIISKYIEALKFSPSLEIKKNLYVNVGNELNTLNRHFESISFYEKAIEIDKNFGMALGNKAITLKKIIAGLYDQGHCKLITHEALNLSKRAIRDNFVEDEMKKNLENFIVHYNNYFNGDQNLLECLNKTKSYNSKEEDEYRNWCAQNKLFINPLNEITNGYITQADPTHLPSFISSIDEGPFLIGMYNNIKQEFVSARYMYYSAVYKQSKHFSDKDVKIIDTFDYSHNSYKFELMKSSFRIFYSIMDKISYIINSYFQVGMKYSNVSYLEIWGYNNILKIRMDETKNTHLNALYSMRYELQSIGNKGTDLNKIQQFKYFSNDFIVILSEIRNSMEHKFLRIQNNSNMNLDLYLKEPEGISYNISRDNFEYASLHLAKVIRNAILYLSMAVKHEEDIRNKSKINKEFIISTELITLNDELKR